MTLHSSLPKKRLTGQVEVPFPVCHSNWLTAFLILGAQGTHTHIHVSPQLTKTDVRAITAGSTVSSWHVAALHVCAMNEWMDGWMDGWSYVRLFQLIHSELSTEHLPRPWRFAGLGTRREISKSSASWKVRRKIQTYTSRCVLKRGSYNLLCGLEVGRKAGGKLSAGSCRSGEGISVAQDQWASAERQAGRAATIYCQWLASQLLSVSRWW